MTDLSVTPSETAKAPQPSNVASIFNFPALGENENPRSLPIRARIVEIVGPVTRDMAQSVMRDLWTLESVKPGAPITMIINSNGGSVQDGWAIIDMMNMISSPVHTCVMGQASSMAATILLAGAKGYRSATPNSRIMMHEASVSGVSGQADDVVISAHEMEHTKERMLEFYAMTTGQSRKVLLKKMARDYFMYPAEALELGVIDKIASFPDCKAAFNAAAQKSNESHFAMHKRRSSPALG